MKVVIERLVILAAVLGLSQTAFGQRDSSSDANGGFVKKVKAAKGVMIRVPVNAEGQENAAKAELRLHVKGKEIKGQEDLVSAWNQSEKSADKNVVNKGETIDGSTHGWWGYRYRRWVRPYYYYYNYTPTYYYYGTTYTYSYRTYWSTPYYRYYYYYW